MLNTVSSMADSELVCNCNTVTKGALVKVIREKGLTSREEVALVTRASTGCGSCAQLVEDLLREQAPQRATPAASAETSSGPALNPFQPRSVPKNLDVAKIKKEGLEIDFSRIRERGVRALSDQDYYRLKTYGVCSQKHPEYFMLRIRIPGGQVTGEQLDQLAELAKFYGRGWGHLTTRQDMELHWVRIEKVSEIWEQLESVGLTTRSACGHTLRNVMACPHSAISAASGMDVGPWAKALSDYFVSRSALINPRMPNRLNIFLAGCSDCAAHVRVNDIGLLAVVNPEGQNQPTSLGFELWVGGSLGSYPVLGFKLRPFLDPEEVLPACQAIFHIHMQRGEAPKGKTRLKFLIEELGRDKFAELFEKAFQNQKALPENRLFPLNVPKPQKSQDSQLARLQERIAAPLRPTALPRGWRAQRQPGYAWCILEIPLGEIRWKQLSALHHIARRYSNVQVHFTMDQNVELHGVRRKQIGPIQMTLASAGFTLKGVQAAPRVVACVGTQFCVLAVTNAPGAAQDLLRQIVPRHQAEAELLRGLSIHISGCPNSCAKHQIADIGLAGGMAPLGDHRRYAYQLSVGGGLEGDARLGVVARKGLTEEMVVPAVQALLEIAQEHRQPGESFGELVRRLGPPEMARQLGEKLTPPMPQTGERVRMFPEMVQA